jgi:D-serine deaminase-like pyridoxal phosphate-dependent protein
MAALARDAGVALRPHFKTHKSVAIARRQIAAGAVGMTVAKLDRAALIGGGVTDILL